ncbi:hypothetical protein ETB97_001525 [Aspergillus alliaceus]|uniref:Cyanovirin-N domain-containing protein n=1 Tax=Petromyces alliaceus TaxID=209559 RepID=A0A5N7CBB2_PETAA|nr:uncharacterized protein BDW43DRAFT_313158 [Aspergillus alliaceus]KAB8231346.1 hypothetical protein BDW43DRAFT_313158 [Aspergillus alliaceus]KAE8391436.1 hypothetical protein BDV23DRAFT_153097 [Aspergillus alliaceus]KAF5865949.1 hypothetical protein ETB97_001525 [Aspergillus burnettii]
MLFSTIIASTMALTMGVSAAPAPRDDPRYVQLRIYGESGCFEQNQGEMGIYGDKLNKCQTFGDTTVKSVRFEYALRDNCTVAIYNDITCHLNRHDVKINTCLSGDKEYGSYLVQC